MAVALARCRAELNSGQAALGSASTGAEDGTDAAALQEVQETANSLDRSSQPAKRPPGTCSPLSQGVASAAPSGLAPAAADPVSVSDAAAVASSPLKTSLRAAGKFSQQSDAPVVADAAPAPSAPDGELKRGEGPVVGGEAGGADGANSARAPAEDVGDAEGDMEVDGECPEEDRTVKVSVRTTHQSLYKIILSLALCMALVNVWKRTYKFEHTSTASRSLAMTPMFFDLMYVIACEL